MTMPEPIPGFRAAEFKRLVQERQYEETRALTSGEEVAHLRRAAEQGPLGAWWRRVLAADRLRRSAPPGGTAV